MEKKQNKVDFFYEYFDAIICKKKRVLIFQNFRVHSKYVK